MLHRQAPMWRSRHGVAVAAALAVVAAGSLGVGVYRALFTGTAATSATYASGTVTLTAIGSSGANNRLSVGATGLAPGDTIERAVDITYTGSITAASVTLTTTASPSSLLDTDTTNGLQLVIQKCSVAWTETSNAGNAPYTYTCGGSTSSVLSSTPVIGSNLSLSNLTLTANTHNYLRATLTFPSAAGNTFQGLSSTITFTFTANQRAGTSQ